MPAPFERASQGARQCLDVIARIAQGAEHTAIRQRDRNMKGARPGHSIALKAYRRSDGKPVVNAGGPEHYLLGRFVVHLLGDGAGFFGSLAPTF